MRTALVITVALLVGLLLISHNTIEAQRAEIERQNLNISALNETARQYKTTAGDYAEETRQLKLERDELELYNKDLYNKVREAGIKIRELKNATRTEAHTIIQESVKTEQRDSTRIARYADGWNSVHVESRPDTTNIEVHSVDTIDVIGRVRQKKFLFFRIGKPIQQVIVSNKNPKCEIHVNFTAEFSK